MTKITTNQVDAIQKTVKLKNVIRGNFYLIKDFPHNRDAFNEKLAFCFETGKVAALISEENMNMVFNMSNEYDCDVVLVPLDSVNIDYKIN